MLQTLQSVFPSCFLILRLTLNFHWHSRPTDDPKVRLQIAEVQSGLLCVLCACSHPRVCWFVLVREACAFKQVALELATVPWLIPKGVLLWIYPEGPQKGRPINNNPVWNLIRRLLLIHVQIRLTDRGVRKRLSLIPPHTLRQRWDMFAFRRKWLSWGVRGERWNL